MSCEVEGRTNRISPDAPSGIKIASFRSSSEMYTTAQTLELYGQTRQFKLIVIRQILSILLKNENEKAYTELCRESINLIVVTCTSTVRFSATKLAVVTDPPVTKLSS